MRLEHFFLSGPGEMIWKKREGTNGASSSSSGGRSSSFGAFLGGRQECNVFSSFFSHGQQLGIKQTTNKSLKCKK
jgi:hypothetical protein